MHANSAADVPARLEALGLMAGLDRQALHALAGAGLDAIVHLGRGAGNTRQVQSVHICQRAAGGEFIALPAWTLEGGEWTEQSAAQSLSKLIATRRTPRV